MADWQFWLSVVVMPLLLVVAGWVWFGLGKLSDRIERVKDDSVTEPTLHPLLSRLSTVEGDLRVTKVDRENGDKASEAFTQGKVAELHQRVNDVQRDYVRRDDFHRDMATMTKQMEDLRADIRNDTARINQRLDTILAVIGRQAPAAE